MEMIRDMIINKFVIPEETRVQYCHTVVLHLQKLTFHIKSASSTKYLIIYSASTFINT